MASMRPRVFPAENFHPTEDRVLSTAASMRPRVFPAENVPASERIAIPRLASMRPRVFPAENGRKANTEHWEPITLQ